MADPTVKLVFTGNSADAERAITNLQAKYDALENKIKHTSRATKDIEGKNPFSSLESGIAGALGKMTAFVSVGAIVSKTIADIQERNQKAFDSQKGLAGAIENLSFMTDVPLNEAISKAKEISQKTGVEMGTVMNNIADAFSAKGHLGAQDAYSAVEAVAKIAPNSLEQQKIIAGATLDIRKVNPELTSEQAQGFLMRAAIQARITNIGQMAEHGAPGILGLSMLDKNNPNSLTESAGIYSAITQGMNDPTGRVSRTAGTALVMQAREFVGDASEKMSNKEVLEYIANDREAFKAFFDGGEYKGKSRRGMQMTIAGPDGQDISIGADRASFERKALPSIKAMMTPGTMQHKNWLSATEAMGDIATTGDDWKAKHAEMQSDAVKSTVDQSNLIKAKTQQFRASDRQSAMSHVGDVDYPEMLQSAGLPWYTRYNVQADYYKLRYLNGMQPEGAMRQSAENLLARGTMENIAGDKPMDDKTIEKLTDMISVLKKIEENSRKQVEQKPIARNGQKEN